MAELNSLEQKVCDEAVAKIEKAFVLEALGRSDYSVAKSASQTGRQRSNFQAQLKKTQPRKSSLSSPYLFIRS